MFSLRLDRSKRPGLGSGRLEVCPMETVNTARSLLAYHRQLFRWHCRHFFNFRRHLHPTELAYLNRCFTLPTDFVEISDGGYEGFSYYTYSHRVKNEEVNSSRFAYGSVSQPKEALMAALPVLEQRGIKVPNYLLEETHFYGLGWDFQADHFKVYFRCSDWSQLPSEYACLTAGHDLQSHRKEALISRTYAGFDNFEAKVYLYPLDEQQAGLAQMMTTQRGQVNQLDLGENPEKCPPLNSTGQAIVAKYREIGEELDTIAYTNENDFTLYFP